MKMKIYFFCCITFCVLFTSCKNREPEKPSFSLIIHEAKPSFTPDEKLIVSIKNITEKKVDSIVYFIDQKQLGVTNIYDNFSVSLENQKLGLRKLHATVYFEKKEETVVKDILLLATEAPKLYGYRIIQEYPHDIDAYTQGLEFFNDILYESTGQYGKSSLRKTNYQTGEILQKIDLDRAYFGEGITILNNKIYQLTWKENTGFIYDVNTLEKTGSFVYSKSPEGWGLCNDGKTIYKSDGTDKIWTLNPNNLTEESFIEIYTNTSRIKSVNELEWIDDKIYANIYQQNAIAIINPQNGAVEGVIDLSDLQKKVKQHQFLDVLNGIAYKKESNTLFITGKNWNKLFEIETFVKQ